MDALHVFQPHDMKEHVISDDQDCWCCPKEELYHPETKRPYIKKLIIHQPIGRSQQEYLEKHLPGIRDDLQLIEIVDMRTQGGAWVLNAGINRNVVPAAVSMMN